MSDENDPEAERENDRSDDDDDDRSAHDDDDRSAHDDDDDDRFAHSVAKIIAVFGAAILARVDLPWVSFPDLPAWVHTIESVKNWVLNAVFVITIVVFVIMVVAIIAGVAAEQIDNRRNRDRADTGDQAPDGHRL